MSRNFMNLLAKKGFRLPIFRVKIKGFTLVELLVVVLIMGMLAGGGIAAYRQLNEKAVVEGAGKQVEQALRDAQKQASARVKPNNALCNNPNTLLSYTIVLSGSSYSINADCSAGAAPAVSKNLPEGTTFTYPNTLVFDIDGLVMNPETICVQDPGGAIVSVVSVTQGGAVSYEGLQGTCPAAP